ncbi:MAG: class I SAM-dependent methyltransferase [Planctomycetes bacterium]|nr:class I SAM-dependent methyltransferase [Planctomycetota bacterium]
MDKESILCELTIQPGQVILDAGCGNGYMAKEFSRAVGETGKVYAVDSDAEVIGLLQQETSGTNIEARVEDITNLQSIEAESVDLIYMSTVFHMFTREQARIFQEQVSRLLKPGGSFAIVEVNKEEPSLGPPPEIRFSPEELQAVIDLAPKATIPVGQYCYLQTFRKDH